MKINYFSSLPGKQTKVYILGVSGGPDSVFLLYKMSSKQYNFVVAHINYGKRADSILDQQLVAAHCQKLGISFFSLNAAAFSKGNFQDYARKVRYAFFIKIADKLLKDGFKLGGIVIAHNFEASLETYQLQVERGAIVNKWGLTRQTKMGDHTIWRPMLSYRKKAILHWLQRQNISYNLDFTNNLKLYRRNVIRDTVFKLNEVEKAALSQTIIEKNQLLAAEQKKVIAKSRLFIEKEILSIGKAGWQLSSEQFQMQIIYIWINNFSENKFITPKKKIVSEIRRKLLSKKASFEFKIGNGILIKKKRTIALLEKVSL